MNGDPEDYIEDLYNDFLESLNNHTSADFDIDELIEIHDYANDTGDALVSFMSLSQAANRYPDDEVVVERLALYFYYHNESRAALQQIERLPQSNFIGQLIGLALHIPVDTGQIRKRLDEIISHVDPHQLSDEDVIRLTEVVVDLGVGYWLYDNYELLKELVEYPDTLMNECINCLTDIISDSEMQLLMEEFTNEYPFNVSGWLMLAEFLINKKLDLKEALNAVNYALAIDPKNYLARLRRVELMIRIGDINPSLIDDLNELLKDYPDKIEAIAAQKGYIYLAIGDSLNAARTLREAIAQVPRSIFLYDLLRDVDAPLLVEREIEQVFTYMDETEIMAWCERFQQRWSLVDAQSASFIARFLLKNCAEFPDNIKFRFMECFYVGGNYADSIALFDRLDPTDCNYPMASLIYALSFKRAGRLLELNEIIDKFLAHADSVSEGVNADERMCWKGVTTFLENLRASLSDPSVPESSYDPFVR